MKIIEIKKEINWGFWLLGKPLLVKKKYFGMISENLSVEDEDDPGEVRFLPMDEDLISKCDGINGYKIKALYNSDKDKGFSGIAMADGEEIVGFICGSHSLSYAWKYPDLKGDSFYIKYVFVDPNYRGKHYARRLIRKLDEQCHEAVYTLMVREDNTNAIRAYEKVGFEKAFLRKFFVFPLIHKSLFYSYKNYKKRQKSGL
ncbi:MAG: GNAT family N-acetyltransferase [Clostridia bacterium]|nr:GNAT family N-acetyltransferase [Clostridia bacterium]